MSIQRPIMDITIGALSLSGPEAAAVEIHCDLSVGSSHDCAVVFCSNDSPLMDAAIGDDVSISLGYEESGLEPVLTGKVTALEYLPTGVAVEILAATAALSLFHVAGSYLQQTIGDIISDLASKANLQVGTIDASQELGVYHIDEYRSAWSHIMDLAALGDYSVTTDTEGALEMQAPKSGMADHTVHYGAELLVWLAGPQRGEEVAWKGAPHGAGSEEGSEKWHLLLKDPTGGCPDAPTRVIAAARDRETAEGYGKGMDARKQRRLLHGRAVVVGSPSIRPGNIVEMVDFEHSDTITGRCRTVCHEIGPTTGFLTYLMLEAVS
jgi:hypothetical protein